MPLEWLISKKLKSIHSTEQAALRKVVRESRLQAGMTQAQLADRLKLPQSFVSKYESGERRLDVLELRRVCVALNISLVDMVQQIERELK